MFQLDFASRVPIYEQICNSVVRLASVGVFKPGDKLPPVRILADQLGINPNTAAKAYRELEAKGYIYSGVGRGSYLTEKLSEHSALKIVAQNELRKAAEKAVKFGIGKEQMKKIIEEALNGGDTLD